MKIETSPASAGIAGELTLTRRQFRFARGGLGQNGLRLCRVHVDLYVLLQ